MSTKFFRKEDKVLILIKNINKIYKSHNANIHAVKNINLQIDTCDIFGIIGLSGAGKSSLIRCLNRLEEPTSGQIIIDDVDITTLSQSELKEKRKTIGMIFQHFNLLSSKTVKDNIAFPLHIAGVKKGEIDKRIDDLLELVDLKDKKNNYPSQLSGGQKQRVGIARALANNPSILLCDEATSALDPMTTKSILSLLKSINKKLGLTIVLITHQMEVIKEICNKVAVIENGEIVEWGRTTDVFSNPTHPTTKYFVSEIHHQIPSAIIESKPHAKLIKLSYKGEYTKKPIISTLVKKFDVDANIMMGSIDGIEDNIVGNLIVALEGESQNIDNAIEYLKEVSVGIEVISGE